MKNFIQGDTTGIALILDNPLDSGVDLKIGIYDESQRLLAELYYSAGDIIKIDDLNYVCNLSHDLTLKFSGVIEFHFAIFNQDKSMVNAGEQVIKTMWQPEVVTKKLR